MKTTYTWLFCLLCALAASQARGQVHMHTFTDAALGPYSQNFDKLTGNAVAIDGGTNGNTLELIKEVYAEAEFTGGVYRQTPIYPNDGSGATASYYHFGTSAGDRAFGGIGGFAFGSTSGIGYVGIRFKNGTTTTIKNLEIKYALEHWYNSTLNTEARVSVSYLKGVGETALTSLVESAGAWQPLTDLGVAAPSTSTSIGKRDGNAASNRRVMSTTLNAINLVAGEEIMIRWAYVLNSNTNGNGFGIDDVVVTPQTNIFYSQTAGDLNDVNTWGPNADGSGIPPANFTADNQTFYVQSLTSGVGSAIDRIGVTKTTLGANWTVSGANSKIVVGSSVAAGALKIQFDKNITARIDVGPGSYLQNQRTNIPAFTLGSLATTSTVEYISNGTPHTISSNQYGNLKISGNNADRKLNQKQLGGNIVVTGALTIGSGSNVALNNYNLMILSGGSIGAGSATAYVVTNGTGRLRMSVPRATSTAVGPNITFPVGAGFTSYTPVTVQQTSTVSDDVFEIGVIDNVFKTYNTTSYAVGEQIKAQVVNKTWFIRKEVPNNPATLNMSLQWNATESSTNEFGADYAFNNTTAHINQNNGAGWDVNKTPLGVGTTTGPYVATRTGIASTAAAPIYAFGVSSRENGALPVELISFDAKRTGASVTTIWATASEKNNDHFTVERSATGAEFAPIGEVMGAGFSSKQLNYAFEDQAPLADMAYYRLRQTDTDGTSSFSPIVVVLGRGVAQHLTAVPNPSTGRFDIWVPTAGVTAVEITNVVGARVLTQTAASAANRLSFDLSAQPAGVYLVRLKTTAGTQVVRVVKH